MKSKTLSLRLLLSFAVMFAALTTVRSASAQQETVFFNFDNGGPNSGSVPYSALISDSAGNFYGTEYGGSSSAGLVYELSPAAGGGWTQEILHSFTLNSTDGNMPFGGVILDRAGNLYGTTCAGGNSSNQGGTVFELKRTKNGWAEFILHSFGNFLDGGCPTSKLLFDSAGNLYGTTNGGGAHGNGTVFELSHKFGAAWEEKILYNFASNNNSNVVSILVSDAAGNLYGTTQNGGAYYYYGTVFEVSPQAGGKWTETTLHSFNHDNNVDGFYPNGVVFDGQGNLYGTTYGGGSSNSGVAYELSRGSGGLWAESIIFNFAIGNSASAVIFGPSGGLYGNTEHGGTGYGTVFNLSPQAGGAWTLTTLYNFAGGTDGEYPVDSLLVDSSGNLYGITPSGGTYGGGTAYKIVP
ncbi:MAG: choice-of-anchor tandem repeat GloVer-containing protein [Candidatus Sulfotelmatobacter sp.]